MEILPIVGHMLLAIYLQNEVSKVRDLWFKDRKEGREKHTLWQDSQLMKLASFEELYSEGDIPTVENTLKLKHHGCLILAAFAALVCAGEVEENEQKKRGAGKTTLNTIPTGVQKPDYTYSIYSQNPSTQSSTSPTYQSQVPNSFYPTQSGANQYYQSASPPQDPSVYPQQPQLNLIPPSQSQFVPLNFVPNPGYQTKYQIVPSKSPSGNIQLAILQPQSILQQPQLTYPQNIFSPSSHPSHQSPYAFPQQTQLAPNYQLPLGSPFGHPSTMLLFSQPNPSIYNNLLYPNAGSSLYNYYQPSPQAAQPKYGLYYGSSSPPNQSPPPNAEYDKLQATFPQNAPKEDNEISLHSSDYLTPAESNTNYKNAYVTTRTSYKN